MILDSNCCVYPSLDPQSLFPRDTRVAAIYGVLWMFMAHFFACALWAIGVADFNVAEARARNKLPWNLRISSKGQAVTWDSTFGDQYWSCFYWSVTVLVKVPWIAPETVYEQIFTVLVILIGTLTFSVIIGQVTMQQKTFDMARQARSERLSKMRTFCSSRGVPASLQREIFQWTLADQEFSSKFVGRGRLTMLPPIMRGPLLQGMFTVLLESFPFKKQGMSTPGQNAILIKLNPLVLMRGMGLILPNSASDTLYVLQKGCLRVALPLDKSADSKGADGKGKRMRSARVSTSPLRGVKGGGLGLKSTKEFARFRVLERPGSMVGIADIDDKTALYPFHVDCTAPTNLFSISREALKQAIGSMSSEDTKICKETLVKEHKAHVDGLKFEGWATGSAKPKAAALDFRSPRRPVFNEAQQSLALLQNRCDTYRESLQTVQRSTRQLVDVMASLGVEPKPKDGWTNGKRRAANGQRLNDRADQNDVDELEERTGYSSAVSNRTTVATSRAIS